MRVGNVFYVCRNITERMEFEAVPGVGAKTADALAELDDAQRALETGDVATLARAPGITEGRAAAIARGAIRIRHDDGGGFLATDRARELYRDVLSLLQARAVTTYAEKRLETLYPSSTASRIEEVHEFTRRAMERTPTADVRDALAGVEPLSSPRGVRVNDRCLATTDAERYAEAREAIPELPVEVVEDTRELGGTRAGVLDRRRAGRDVHGRRYRRRRSRRTRRAGNPGGTRSRASARLLRRESGYPARRRRSPSSGRIGRAPRYRRVGVRVSPRQCGRERDRRRGTRPVDGRDFGFGRRRLDGRERRQRPAPGGDSGAGRDHRGVRLALAGRTRCGRRFAPLARTGRRVRRRHRRRPRTSGRDVSAGRRGNRTRTASASRRPGVPRRTRRERDFAASGAIGGRKVTARGAAQARTRT